MSRSEYTANLHLANNALKPRPKPSLRPVSHLSRNRGNAMPNLVMGLINLALLAVVVTIFWRLA